jgi:hypothetical protein
MLFRDTVANILWLFSSLSISVAVFSAVSHEQENVGGMWLNIK